MTSPAEIEMALKGMAWEAVPDGPKLMGEGDLPHVTHKGVLGLLGHSLRCYRLSSGETVFDADDFQKFMADWLGPN